jgi:hypothetical protein
MTATETARGTALAQVASGDLALVEGGHAWTVATLADALAGPAVPAPEAESFPSPPKPVKDTPQVLSALKDLPALFGSVHADKRRVLTEEELKVVTREHEAISAVTKPLGKRADEIAELIRMHMDVDAEGRGIALAAAQQRGGAILRPATQRVPSGIAAGHYLLARPEAPYETGVEGFEHSWQQRFVSGKVTKDLSALEQLEQDGTVTRAEYLSFTRETRVLDDEKIAAAIRRAPGRGLQILKAITARGRAGASLYPPTK